MLANAGQIEHEAVLNLLLHLRVHGFQHRVVIHGGATATQVIVPVGRPRDRVDGFAIQLRHRSGRGLGFLPRRRRKHLFVLVGPRLVIVFDGGQIRVVENGGELLQPATGPGGELPGLGERPPALPLVLVFPTIGVAHAGAGFHIIEPNVFRAFTVGPRLLTGHRAGVTADALVQVHNHCDLSHDFHE